MLRKPPYLEEKLSVSVRSVIISKHSQRPHDFHTSTLHGDQNHGLLLVRCRGEICLAHEDADLAARVHCATGPPLVPIQDIVVSLPAQDTNVTGTTRRSCQKVLSERTWDTGTFMALHSVLRTVIV